MASIDIKFSGATKELEDAVGKIAQQLGSLQSSAKTAGDNIDKAFKSASKGAQSAQRATEQMAGEMMNLESIAKKAGAAMAGYFAVDQIMAFGSACIEVRKEFESLEVSFSTLLGSEQKGKAMFDSLTQFATTTPLMEKDIAQAAQTLLGFNIEAEKVLPMLKAIGDVSMGDAQKFQSLTLAFAQATSAGKLMGQDLMQMINAGFNPLGEMSRTTGKSISQLKDEMEKGGISAQMLEEAFVSATSEGGKFNGMLESMSKTMQGAKSNLDGAIQKFEDALGEAIEPVFVEIVNRGYETVNEITEAFESLDLSIDTDALKEALDEIEDAIKAIVVGFGTFKAAELTLTGITAATKAWAAATATAEHAVTLANVAGVTMTKTQYLLSAATTRVSVAWKALTTAMLSNPITMAAAAFAALAASMYAVINNVEKVEYKLKDLKTAEQEANESTAEEITRLKQLRETAEDTNKSLDERKKAVDALQTQYPKYFGNMSQEKIMCGEVGDAYRNLADEILQAARARAAYEMMVENEKEMLRLEQELEAMDEKKIQRGQQLLKQQSEFIKQTSKQVGTANGATYAAMYLQRQTNEYTTAALHAGALFNAIDKLKKANDKLKEQAEAPDTTTPKVTPPTTTKKKGSKSTGKSQDEIRREAEEALAEQYKAFGKSVEDISEQVEGEIVKAYQRTIANSMQLRIDTLDSEHEDMLETIQTNTDAEKRALEESAKKIYEAQLALEIAQGKRKKDDKPTFSREALKALLPDLDAVLQAQEDALDEAARNLTDFENTAYMKQWRDLYDELLGTSEDYLQKRETLQREYGKRIEDAMVAFDRAPAEQKEGIKRYVEDLQRQLQEALSQLDNTKFEQMVDLNSMLGNVSGASSERLDEMAAGLEKIIAANKDLTPDGIQRVKQLNEALSQLYAVRLEKNPAAEIKAATEALKRAKQELADAEQAKAQADASRVVDYEGSFMNIGSAYQQAMLEGNTQAMAQYYDMVVKVGEESMKYGDVLKTLTLAQGKFSQSIERTMSAQEKQYKQFQKVIGAFGKASNAIQRTGTNYLNKQAAEAKAIHNIVEEVESNNRRSRSSAKNEENSELLYLQKLLESIAARIAEINYEYDELKDKLKGTVYSHERASIYAAMNENLEIENGYLNDYIKLQEKVAEAGGEADKSLKSYEDKIRENNKLIKENGEAMVEAIMGEDVKAAIERFGDAVSDSWTDEGSIKDSARKAVKTMVKNMVTESLKQDLNEPVRQLQERMMAMYTSKGIITPEDMARFESEAEQLAKRMEAKYGFMDDMLKDLNSKFDGTSGAFETMSQESADELNGRFAQAQQAVQGTFEAMLHVADELGMANNALNAINNAFTNLEESVALANGYLYSIDANVAKMAKEVIPSLQTIETIVKRDR